MCFRIAAYAVSIMLLEQTSTIKEKCGIWGFKIPEYYIELNGHQLYKPYENTFVCDRVKKREDAISDIVVKPFYREDKLSAVFWYGETRFWGTVLNNEIKVFVYVKVIY